MHRNQSTQKQSTQFQSTQNESTRSRAAQSRSTLSRSAHRSTGSARSAAARRVLLGLSAAAAALGGASLGATTAGATPATGVISAVAGTGSVGYTGDGSAATSATLRLPLGVAVDAAGDLAIADTDNDVVRFVPASSGTYFGRLMTGGDIYTIAGTGTPGSFGDGVPGASAELDGPRGLAFDPAGDVIVADSENNEVRLIANSSSFYGIASVAGDIYTLAGSPVSGYSGDGGPAILAKLHDPADIAVDTDGFAVADSENNAVRFIASSSGSYFGTTMVRGDIYTIAGGTSGYNGDGRPAVSAELTNPNGVALDASGDLAIADTGNFRVRFVPATSGSYFGASMVSDDIYTVAGNGTLGYTGDGASATSAELDRPYGVAFDGLGDLGVSDTFNHVVRLVPAASGTYFGASMQQGDIYTIAGDGVSGTSGDGNPATSAELTYPAQLGFTSNDSLVFADVDAYKIREVESGFSAPSISAASSASATVGQSFSFTASASGQPTPSVTVSGALPSGLSFTAGSNGTATISGTPSAAGSFTVDLDASNGVGPAVSAPLTITVSSAPTPPPTTVPPTPPTKSGGSDRCTVVHHGSASAVRLNPTSLLGRRGQTSTIEGCLRSPTTVRQLTVTALYPSRVWRSSTVTVSKSGTFRFVTGKLNTPGSTVVTFKSGRKVVLTTTIHVA
jgi:hypothetical protein